MYHLPNRPPLLLSGITGGMCAVGALCLVARALHTFTSFNLRQPFDALSFVLAVVGTVGGAFLIGTLRIRSLSQRNAILTAEVEELRAKQRTYDTLVEHIQKADAQVEVTTVLCRKILAGVEREQANADTQPIATLRSITGGGSA